MQIICISRGSYGYSNEVAERLANKTGYLAISRETIADKATEFGIPTGKLEMMIIKNRPLTEEMSIIIDMFKAYATSYICERALNESVIYHGRTGHLFMPGLSNILRVRAIADPEYRIEIVMNRLRLDRDKAKNYIQQTDDDIRRWTHTLYNTDWNDPSQYDITINAAHLSAENAATALIHFAHLPEFQSTPASRQMQLDLLLAARCRLAIGKNENTRNINTVVHAEKGNVSVTYMPRHAKTAKEIPTVLEKIEGMKSLVCTIATTNIICIGEKFNPEEEAFNSLIEISKKWNAAIEIIRIAGENPPEGEIDDSHKEAIDTRKEHGGIMDDSDKAPEKKEDSSGIHETMDKLIQVGHAGGMRTVYGGIDDLLEILPKTEHFSLIAVGDVFSAKGAASQRLKRDMIGKLKDKFRIPVIGTEDLKSKYLFGFKQLVSLILFGILSALIYFGLIEFQVPILTFISKGHFGGTFSMRIVAAVAVFVTIPVVAFIIGGFFSNLLKLLKVE